MLFAEMVEALIDGKYCTRILWQNSNTYLALMPTFQNIWLINNAEKAFFVDKNTAVDYAPSISDLLADDWIELKVKNIDPI